MKKVLFYYGLRVMVRKVAIFTGFDPYKYKGGLERYTVNLANLLKKNGIKVDIFFPTRFNDVNDIYAYTLQVKDLIEKNYNMLIANSPYAAFTYDFDIKKITIFHISFRAMAENTKDYVRVEDFLRWFYIDGILEFMSLFSDYNVAVSNFLKNTLENLYGNMLHNKIFVVENGIDVKKFKPITAKKTIREKYGIPKDAFVGLYVGRNDATKGYDIFKEVYNETKHHIYWIQVLASGGVNQYKLLPIKTFREVSEEIMVDLYNLSNFTYLPSRFEGFGLTFIESLACKTPAITTNTGIAKNFSGIWEEIKIKNFNEDVDYCIDQSIKAIQLLKNYKYIREYMANKGRQIVVRKYSINVWARNMLNLINRLLNYTSSSA